MSNRSSIINVFILFIYLLLVLIVFIIYNNQDNLSNHNYNKFIEDITQFESYDNNKLNEYEKKYLETNNLILSLNSVNHPDFYNNSIKMQNTINNNLALVNRKYYLPNNYCPSNLIPITNVNKIIRKNEIMQLTKDAFNAYLKLYSAMKNIGLNIYVFSAYRTYEKQIEIYNTSTNKNYVAKAGHSEHQTGLVLDLSTLDTGLTNHFEYTKEFNYLITHAHLYGFILRYPKGKENITGYSYEPWHYRYVGITHATIIYENKLTLEEYIYNYIPM